MDQSAKHQVLARELWGELDWQVADTRSLALIDRSTVARATALMREDFHKFVPARPTAVKGGVRDDATLARDHFRLDPFVAVADLAAIVSAALFYDRLAVVHGSPTVDRDFHSLGVQSFASRISPGERGDESVASNAMGHLLQDAWSSVFSNVSNNWNRRGSDLSAIEGYWKSLLPNLKTLDLRSSECRYTASPNQPTWPVFDDIEGNWEAGPREFLASLVRDNTYRGLFYVRLADEFERLLSFEDNEVEVRYVGGCLRTPVQLAVMRADLRDGAPLEHDLERFRPIPHAPVRMPFWFSAVMSCCDTRDDLPAAIAQVRDLARPIRRRRKELSIALGEGNMRETARVKEAMNAAFADFEKELARHAPKALETAAKVVVSTSLVSSGATTSASLFSVLETPIVNLVRRVFRPHIAAIHELSSAADACTNSLRTAARVFGFPQSFVTGSADFLTQLGRVAWVA